MYIQTDKIENIVDSISKLLGCSLSEIEIFSRSLFFGCEEGMVIYDDRIRKKLIEFIKESVIKKIDMVYMHHLSRRLDGDFEDMSICSNMHEVLIKGSSLSRFLNSFGIYCLQDENSIRMNFRGKDVSFENGRPASARLKIRLGQYNNYMRDHGINGLAFADRIEKSGYYAILYKGPELLTDIAEILNLPEMISEFKKNSTFFRYTFLLPIDMPIIGSNIDANEFEKSLELLTECFYRLNEFYCMPDRDRWVDNRNIYMRLDDSISLSSEYLVGRFEI